MSKYLTLTITFFFSTLLVASPKIKIITCKLNNSTALLANEECANILDGALAAPAHNNVANRYQASLLSVKKLTVTTKSTHDNYLVYTILKK